MLLFVYFVVIIMCIGQVISCDCFFILFNCVVGCTRLLIILNCFVSFTFVAVPFILANQRAGGSRPGLCLRLALLGFRRDARLRERQVSRDYYLFFNVNIAGCCLFRSAFFLCLDRRNFMSFQGAVIAGHGRRNRGGGRGGSLPPHFLAIYFDKICIFA